MNLATVFMMKGGEPGERAGTFILLQNTC
jgi:hypothetical protein